MATEIFAQKKQSSSKSIYFNLPWKKLDYWQKKNDGTLQQHSIKIQNWFLSAAPHHPACWMLILIEKRLFHFSFAFQQKTFFAKDS